MHRHVIIVRHQERLEVGQVLAADHLFGVVSDLVVEAMDVPPHEYPDVLLVILICHASLVEQPYVHEGAGDEIEHGSLVDGDVAAILVSELVEIYKRIGADLELV